MAYKNIPVELDAIFFCYIDEYNARTNQLDVLSAEVRIDPVPGVQTANDLEVAKLSVNPGTSSDGASNNGIMDLPLANAI